ncbi:transposase [Microvirga splendida]
MLAAHVRLVYRQLKETSRQLDELCEQIASLGQEAHPDARPGDAAILRSLPGGRMVLATLLSEASDPLSRRDHQALHNLCGVTPVTRRSGKRWVVSMRRAAHVRLRLALYHRSRVAIQTDATSRSRYDQLRERGHSHPRALHSVADRLLNVACAMLRHGTLFNPEPPEDFLPAHKSSPTQLLRTDLLEGGESHHIMRWPPPGVAGCHNINAGSGTGRGGCARAAGCGRTRPACSSPQSARNP